MTKKSRKSHRKKTTKCKRRKEDEEDEEEPQEGCEWMVIQYQCTSPLGESENLPSTCSPRCPARHQNNRIAMQRGVENRSMYQ
jgi:hypothetical protein